MATSDCRVIAVMNQKGGVGKTTTTLNLGAALAEMGKRVLLVDMDHQASLTLALGVADPNELERTTAELLSDCISHLTHPKDPAHPLPDYRQALLRMDGGIDLLPASMNLSSLDQMLATSLIFGRTEVLTRLLSEAEADYDFILIDSAPALNSLTSNILVAATEIIVPTTLAYLSFKGLDLLLSTIAQAQTVNPRLTVLGVLPTMKERRRTSQAEVLKALRTSHGLPVFATEIPKSVVGEEAPGHGVSSLSFSPKGVLANAYRALAKEVLA
jgi:chromosome partitioning protein